MGILRKPRELLEVGLQCRFAQPFRKTRTWPMRFYTCHHLDMLDEMAESACTREIELKFCLDLSIHVKSSVIRDVGLQELSRKTHNILGLAVIC